MRLQRLKINDDHTILLRRGNFEEAESLHAGAISNRVKISWRESGRHSVNNRQASHDIRGMTLKPLSVMKRRTRKHLNYPGGCGGLSTRVYYLPLHQSSR